MRFRVHTRRTELSGYPSNVFAAPWEKDPARLYGGVRLMLVPSQVAEAYGRVAIEALGHGVPVLASGVGGLPENAAESSWLVEDYRSPAAWCAAFGAAWGRSPAAREAAYGFAQERRRVVEAQHDDLVARLSFLLGRGAGCGDV
ncbi:hypothetical protein WCLP8_190001 [uncultured Gammaproteobacteria bacterium]